MTPLDATLEQLLFTALIGVLIGSFISMLSWRLPRQLNLTPALQLKSLSTSRSKCPHCKAILPWYRLFPIFSWLVSHGQCHACQAPISKRYPLIETATLLLTTLIIWHFGFNLTGFLAVIFTWFLITICTIDIEHFLILDKLSLPLMWLGLAINTQGIFTAPEQAIWGAIAGYLILWTIFQVFKLITGKEGMGYGDFKLLAALAAWTGAAAIPQIIFIAALASIFIGVILALTKIRNLNEPIPFGPYLAIGGLSSLMLGPLFLQNLL